MFSFRMLKLESKKKNWNGFWNWINVSTINVRYSSIGIDIHLTLSDCVNLPVSACDQVTRSGTWVVVDVVVDSVVFVALNFGSGVVTALDTYDTVVKIGFFFWGGVGLVPVDVIMVGCAVAANFVGVDCVAPKEEKKYQFYECQSIGKMINKM